VRVSILRTGDAIPEVAASRGEFSRWIREASGDVAAAAQWHEHDVRTTEPLPSFDGVSAVIVTGSASSVTERAGWMLRTEECLRHIHAAGLPLLGICFGHQIIAQALGGHVTKNPRGREIGTVAVKCVATSEALFAGLPDEFHANATHVDTVARLPEGGRVLATTSLESHAAYAVGETTRGVQFHPEIDGDVMRGYVRARASVIRAEGLCPDGIASRVHDAPQGSEVLRNFFRHVVVGRRRSRAA
jgi:GMP synthase (glutamine-hydrolysing)